MTKAEWMRIAGDFQAKMEALRAEQVAIEQASSRVSIAAPSSIKARDARRLIKAQTNLRKRLQRLEQDMNRHRALADAAI